MNRFRNYLETAVAAAQAGGVILKRNYGKLNRSQVYSKGTHDWVTDVDHASEKAVLKVIRKNHPTHAIMAEESAPKAAMKECQWLIDPLDGTINYLHGFPMFGVSIGLVYEGKLTAGAIYDPFKEELFTAVRGGGAYLNKKRLKVSGRQRLEESLIATGFPFRAQNKLDVYLESFKAVFLKTGSIRRPGSAALDLAYVACGRLDGFWEMSLSPWDIGAGALMVQEAGGAVTNFFGKETFLRDGHVACGNKPVHQQLVHTISPVFRGKIE
jgi:myo-inositol-1(or 4)-monophosphatase